MTKIRIIQVGLGGWGQGWALHVVRPYLDVEPVAWVEVDAETLASAQKRLELPLERCFTSLDTALATVETDAVLITASLPGHVPSALTALQAGKHVLMEKPFAPTLAEAQQIVALAEQRGCTLMISQNYRFTPAVRKVMDLVREQVPGRIDTVNIDFRRYSNSAPVENNRHYRLWQPLLVDMSIHHFDLMRAVLNQEPVQVSCKTWNAPWSKFVEDPEGAMTITFDGGAVVNYRGSWISPAPQTNWAGEWSMQGEAGELAWTSRGELPDKVLLRPLGKRPRSFKLPTLEYQDRSGSLHAFVQALHAGTQPESSGRSNLKTLALMLATIESAKSGQPVNLPAIS